MKKLIVLFMVSVCIILFSTTSFAKVKTSHYMTDAFVMFDSSYYPEFVFERGGPEGHSGAYILLTAGIVDYDELIDVRIVAEHKDPDFEVTLIEGLPDCANNWPTEEYDQSYGIRLKPADWMTGEWEFTLKAETTGGDDVFENIEVNVRAFGYPPEPTGIFFGVSRDDPPSEKYLFWNSIGLPGLWPDNHIEYRIMHYDQNFCIDDKVTVRGDSWNYRIIGEKIRVTIPNWWASGDLVRVENRSYSSPGDIPRYGP
ncbi:MAG: hypothetical protein P8Y96_14230 [Desulfuromonadales bacterium]